MWKFTMICTYTAIGKIASFCPILKKTENQLSKPGGCVVTMFFFLSFSLFVLSSNVAQSSGSAGYKGAEFFAMTGLHLRNTSSLNKDLDRHDLPKLDGSLIGTGIGGGIFMKNFFIGGQGMIQFSSGTSNDFYGADLFEGYGMLVAGGLRTGQFTFRFLLSYIGNWGRRYLDPYRRRFILP